MAQLSADREAQATHWEASLAELRADRDAFLAALLKDRAFND